MSAASAAAAPSTSSPTESESGSCKYGDGHYCIALPATDLSQAFSFACVSGYKTAFTTLIPAYHSTKNYHCQTFLAYHVTIVHPSVGDYVDQSEVTYRVGDIIKYFCDSSDAEGEMVVCAHIYIHIHTYIDNH